MKMILVRHGRTEGNREKRYVGRTDEPILEEERQRLPLLSYPPVHCVYVSPKLRCVQTAELIYPSAKKIIVDDLAECDFGEFEYRNWMELSDNPAYQRWIDSGGLIGFPQGEDRPSFIRRCMKAYDKICAEAEIMGEEQVGVVAHGGTIMALLSQLSNPKGEYYSFQVNNGSGYILDTRTGEYEKIEDQNRSVF